ncbi:MAG: DUF58 domain-containing protein [Phycisphaerales bacterium]
MSKGAPIRRRFHVHAMLLVFAGLTLLLAVGAFNSNNNLLFWLFGLALSLIVVSGLISGTMLMGLRVERVQPRPGTAGEVMRVEYRVRNLSRVVPCIAVRVAERPGPGPEVQAFIAYVGPRQSKVIEGLCVPFSRGRWRLDRFVATTEFPFGIIRKSLIFRQGAALVVHPAALDPGPLEGAERGRGEQTGAAPMVSRWRAWLGEEQLAGIREYAPGDQASSIAWRASARAMAASPERANLLVREHLTAPPLPRDVMVQLDLRRAHTDADYERTISRALGVARRLSGARGAAALRVGLVVLGRGVLVRPRPRSLAAIVQELTDLPRFGQAADLLNAPSAAGPATTPTVVVSTATDAPTAIVPAGRAGGAS